MFCLQHIDDKYELKKWNSYYYQIQGQLHITRRNWGSVGIYGTHKTSILGPALIYYVTCTITWSGFTVSLLHK